ncbi:hypothetical protein F5Y16DRAFT_59224 [Xylariaceae sp. FL0255]|nr:hypothetical protein F5Y16DRAFT_59224 [Xylariaceae sp. FL0255]
MVSFFGLKLGAEKKKKTVKDLQISGPRPLSEEEANAIEDEGLFDLEGLPSAGYAASVYSLSRQDSNQSSKSRKTGFLGFGSKLTTLPFALDNNKSKNSLFDRPSPYKFVDSNHSGLKHHASNPNLGRRWNTGSSTSLSLAPPPPLSAVPRPSTSDGKKKNWVNPLDVHYARDSAPLFKAPSAAPFKTIDTDLSRKSNESSVLSITGASTTTPRSPLGQYELKLDLPSDVATLFADLPSFDGVVKPPEPLRIKKQPSTRILDTSFPQPPLQNPPTPPSSVDGTQVSESPMTAPSKPFASENRLSSSRSNREEPTGLRELQSVLSSFGPSPLPTPTVSPRVSDDEIAAPTAHRGKTKDGESKPVIQNVRAKRDTLTINPQRRRSFQMKLEESERATHAIPSAIGRPKTSSGPGRIIERPPPLQLNLPTRFSASDRNGPKSAPFLANPAQSGSPLRSSPILTEDRNISSPLTIEREKLHSSLDSPTGSSVYGEDDEDAHPGSPGSPLIPLTGPLASPCFPPTPAEDPYPHYPHPSSFKFPRKDDIHGPLPPPRSAKRPPATPDSEEWPLPSLHSVTSPLSPLPPTTTIAAETQRLRTESSSTTKSHEFAFPPLEPPRLPGVRSSRTGAESPTMRSFSRPWTPTAAESKAPPSMLKRAETMATGSSNTSSIGGGLRPPPRSATVKAMQSSERMAAGTSTSGVVGAAEFDFGTAGFI